MTCWFTLMVDAMPGQIYLQGTLALIKPDAFQRRIEIEEIILKEGGLDHLRASQWLCDLICILMLVVIDQWHPPILSWGFRLVDKKRLRFTRELAEEFYQDHAEKPFFRLAIDIKSTTFDAIFVQVADRVHDQRGLHGACFGKVSHKNTLKTGCWVLTWKWFQQNQIRPDGIEYWRKLIGPKRFSELLGAFNCSHSQSVSFKGFWSKKDSAKKYSRTVWGPWWRLKVPL